MCMSIFLACIHVYSGEGVRVSETGVEWLLAFMCVLGTKPVLSIRAEGVLHCRAISPASPFPVWDLNQPFPCLVIWCY